MHHPPFTTWEDFVQYREPFGLGMRVEIANAQPMPEREVGIMGGKAGPGRGKKTGDHITRFDRGTSATYLAARLKRDSPDFSFTGSWIG